MLSTFFSAFLVTLLAARTSGHSWIEQMTVIGDNGSYTGEYGYPRGYIVRDNTAMTVLAPPDGQARTKIDGSDLVCSQSQSQPNSNTAGWPQLQVTSGDYVAAKYLENGHVTSAQNQVGKPGSGGLIYIYGTTKTGNPAILNVTQWTADAPLSEGRLLAINNFDDGRCYQINPASALSAQRQAKFPDPVPGQPESSHEQWCETNFQIPSDAGAGSLAVYWVWQWPTLPNRDPNDASGKDEIYTSCADITVVSSASQMKTTQQQSADPVQDPQTKAVDNYKARAANVTFPADPAFYGPSQKQASSGTSAVAPQASGSQISTSAATAMATSSGGSPATITVTVTATPSECTAPSLTAAASVSNTSVTILYTTEMVTVTSYSSLPTPTHKAASTLFTTEMITVTSYSGFPFPTGFPAGASIKRRRNRFFGSFE